MKKTKNKLKKNDPKVFINHGIYHFSLVREPDIFYRNTTTYFPIPVKFRELLEKTYLDCWYIKRTIIRFKKPIKMEKYAQIPIEFTMAHEPIMDIKVISIVHPLDQFKRKTGVKIIRNRMKWALKKKNYKKKRSWKSNLKR